METKTFTEWEEEKHFLHTEADDSMQNMILTEEAFMEIIHRDHALQIVKAVHHDDRVKFLQDNGYEVTRENMTDPNLSVREITEVI